MKQSEAVALANNIAVILQSLDCTPNRAVDFVKSLLLKDPVGLMKTWIQEGNYLPFSELSNDGNLIVYLTLEELKHDREKLAVIQRLWLTEGKKVEAIKQVRVWTRAGLKEAKDFVEEL